MPYTPAWYAFVVLVETLEQLPPTFTGREAVAAGVPRHRIFLLRDAGLIEQISRGVYRKTDAPETGYIDLIAVAKRAPRGVVCLISALAVHNLTDEVPTAVQMAVPRGVHVPKIDYPPTEFSRFDPDTFQLGRSRIMASPGEWVPVYSPERTLVDVMRMRHRWGETVALKGLRTYLSEPSAKPTELAHLARQVGDAGPLLHAMRVILS
jgi:predicted transcriptional regulator of viral defense system